MLEYLARNKEWIFSGVGVSAVTAIIVVARSILHRHRDGGRQSTRPFPAEIVRDIRKRPPLQQSEASQHYSGLRVIWKVAFSSAHMVKEGRANLMLLDRGHYPWVYADVSVDEYPAIKTLPERTELWVSGTIQRCEGNTITLSDAKLTNV